MWKMVKLYRPRLIIIDTLAAATPGQSTSDEDAMGAGWFIKVKMSDPAQLDELMDEDTYQQSLD